MSTRSEKLLDPIISLKDIYIDLRVGSFIEVPGLLHWVVCQRNKDGPYLERGSWHITNVLDPFILSLGPFI